MHAITQDRYGSVDVLNLAPIDPPSIGDNDLLVEVHATSVTTADWRMRTATFPPGMRLVGRLVVGLLRPRSRLTGREFSGRVVAVGPKVTRFKVGDEVFGAHDRGANAELIAVSEAAGVARKPRGLSHAEAAALPFGAITSIDFLIDRAKIRPGERVLVLGASGGVGAYAVQVARHCGAHVTGVCSTGNLDMVRALGADAVIDYTAEDPRAIGASWDVIVDPTGKSDLRSYRHALREGGRHLFIEGGVREVWQAMTSRWRRGPTAVWGVSIDHRAAMERVRELVEAGAIRPVIGHRFPMTAVREAHRVVERRRRRGAVILDWPAAGAGAEAAPLRRVG